MYLSASDRLAHRLGVESKALMALCEACPEMTPRHMSNVSKTSVSLDIDLVRAVEEALLPGQSVAGFVEEAVRGALIRRQFIRKAAKAADLARASGHFVSSEQVLGRLRAILEDRAKRRD